MPVITLEDAIRTLEKNPTPFELQRHADVLIAGVVDMAKRIQALENAHLQDMHRLTELEAKIADYNTRLGGVEADRGDYGRRLDAVEKAPGDVAKQLDEIKTRLRTVEGAVGAAGVAKNVPDAAPAVGKPALKDEKPVSSAATPFGAMPAPLPA